MSMFIRPVASCFVLSLALLCLSIPAAAQPEIAAPTHQFSIWFNGAFDNGRAFGDTSDGRMYEVQVRYGRRLIANGTIGLRYMIEAVPFALVGDPNAGTGQRRYIFGAGGSPIGLQVNLHRFRRFEPFVTSNGGFLYFMDRVFSPGATQFNFTAEFGAGVQVFCRGRRNTFDLGYKYHHISNADMHLANPAMDSHTLFAGISFLR